MKPRRYDYGYGYIDGRLEVKDVRIPNGYIYCIGTYDEVTLNTIYLYGRLIVRGVLYVTNNIEGSGILDIIDDAVVEVGV